MKVMVVDTTDRGEVKVVVPIKDIVVMANVLEQSFAVKTFYIEGLNVVNQQAVYGGGKHTKWISPISQ